MKSSDPPNLGDGTATLLGDAALESVSGGASVFEAYRPMERAFSSVGWFVTGGATNWGLNYLAEKLPTVLPREMSPAVSEPSATSAVLLGTTSSVGAIAGGMVGTALDRGLSALEGVLDPSGRWFRETAETYGYPEDRSAYFTVPGQPLVELNKNIGYEAVNRVASDFDATTSNLGSAASAIDEFISPKPVDPDSIGLERREPQGRHSELDVEGTFNVVANEEAPTVDARTEDQVASITQPPVEELDSQPLGPTVVASDMQMDNELASS